MKILSSALLAAGLFALSACGGGSTEAANNVTADTYNVSPDELGNEAVLGNETFGNEALSNEATNVADNSAANTTNAQ